MSTHKLALITGGGKRRIGNCVARTLAARGYDVALHYHHSADEARQTAHELNGQGIRCEPFQADVSQPAEVERLFDAVLGPFGRIDVLVTAAAVWERKRLEEVTADDVLRQFSINTLGTFLFCQRAGLIMARQPSGGAIVTIGDWAAARPYADYAAYFAGKGAIPTITRVFAVELARRNPAVRVNCILPGPVMLPDELTDQEVQGAVAGTLLKRPGNPEHVAQAVLFLVENDYVTGVCLPVDGGRTIAERPE